MQLKNKSAVCQLEYVIPEQSLPWPSTSSRAIVPGDFMNISVYLQRKPWMEEENEFEFAVKVSIQCWAAPQLEESQSWSLGREPRRHPWHGAGPSSAAGELSWAHRRDLCIICSRNKDLKMPTYSFPHPLLLPAQKLQQQNTQVLHGDVVENNPFRALQWKINPLEEKERMKPKHRAETTKIHTGCTSECTIPHIPPEHVPSIKLLPRAALLAPHGCIPWLPSFRQQGEECSPLAVVFTGHICLRGRVGHSVGSKTWPRAPSPALLLQKGTQGCPLTCSTGMNF